MLDRLPVSDFGRSSTRRRLRSLSFPLGDDFMLDFSPIGNLFSSTRWQLWSSSPLSDDFTLDCPSIDDFGRLSTRR